MRNDLVRDIAGYRAKYPYAVRPNSETPSPTGTITITRQGYLRFDSSKAGNKLG